MATALPNPTVSKSKFKNWVKCALAVLFTKEEIEPVVCNEIENFQQKCLHDIAILNSLPIGSICSNCCTENVIVCPTYSICKIKRGKCKYHRNNTTQYHNNGCPNKICHNLKSEVEKNHRFHGPSFKNTDASQWCSNAWEIAKCFMPPDGYKDVTSAQETDFNGIISVIINYKGFEAKITDKLSKPGNIFEQGREVCKDIRHSPALEVEDAKLTQYFTILNKILNDPGFKACRTSQQTSTASQKLTQLQNDELVIGKEDVLKVLDDAGKVIMDKLRNEADQYRKKLLEITHQTVKDMTDREQVSLTQLSETLQSSIDTLEVKTDQSIKKIDCRIEQGKQTLDVTVREGIRRFNIERESAFIQLQERKDILDRDINRRSSVIERLFCCIPRRADESTVNAYSRGADNLPLKECTTEIDYQLQKEYLKADLIEFYRDKNSTIPLSPLFEHKDTPMLDFYIRPGMKLVPLSLSNEEESSVESKLDVEVVTSLSDIFETGEKAKCELYLTADAGFGKTSFSKHLALSWCQAHEDVKKVGVGEMSTQKAGKKAARKAKYRASEETDKACMLNFEFLFLVFLRDSYDLCSTDELILKQISKLSRCNQFKKEFILKILHEEKCLVILDGLDEWIHPDNKCSEHVQIPHRSTRKKCSILTTTRPWKFGLLSLKSNEIDRHIELVGLTDKSAQTLEKRAIARIRKQHYFRGEKHVTAFRAKIMDNKLEDLEKIPLLLMYLICLWFENKELGTSKCEVYCRILELLLSRTLKTYQGLRPVLSTSLIELPECITKYETCKKYSSIIMALAELAYHALFNEKRENTGF